LIKFAFVSFFTYFQNLGSSLRLPNFGIPPKLQNFFYYITNFINGIQQLIPSLPQLDLRAQLAFLCYLIPFVLDLFFTFFVSNFISSIRHIIDIASFLLLTFSISWNMTLHWETSLPTILISISIPWIFFRLIYLLCARKSNQHQLNQIVSNIGDYYMRGVIPGVNSKIDIDLLQDQIQHFSKVVEIK